MISDKWVSLLMSKADEIFIAMCKDILENGVSSEGRKSKSKMG